MQVRDHKLDEQISQIRYSYTNTGQIRVETKSEMRKRGLVSPDRADAVLMAIHVARISTPGLIPKAKDTEDTPKERPVMAWEGFEYARKRMGKVGLAVDDMSWRDVVAGMVGALVAVNALGSAVIGDGPQFWAGLVEHGSEFGGFGVPPRVFHEQLAMRVKGDEPENTTIAIVVTDAALSKAQLKRIAVMAHDGMGRALRPTHAMLDGDVVFAAATARKSEAPTMRDLTEIGMVSADCLARAIARGVYEATALPHANAQPAWRDRFGDSG
jgi:hypothetical protein